MFISNDLVALLPNGASSDQRKNLSSPCTCTLFETVT